MKNILTVKNMAVIAILGVLGAILMMFDFPIAIAPAFYKLDLSDLPCLIGGFALGPIPALFIELIKIIVKLLFPNNQVGDDPKENIPIDEYLP